MSLAYFVGKKRSDSQLEYFHVSIVFVIQVCMLALFINKELQNYCCFYRPLFVQNVLELFIYQLASFIKALKNILFTRMVCCSFTIL